MIFTDARSGRPVLGRVWGEGHDEVGVEGGGYPLQQGDGGHHAAGFEAGEGGLGHAGSGGEFGLRQAQCDPPFPYGLADEEGAPSFGVPFLVCDAWRERGGGRRFRDLEVMGWTSASS